MVLGRFCTFHTFAEMDTKTYGKPAPAPISTKA